MSTYTIDGEGGYIAGLDRDAKLTVWAMDSGEGIGHEAWLTILASLGAEPGELVGVVFYRLPENQP